MPRNVRNFWIELQVDGRASRIETGPVSKNGGFSMTIRMRDDGGILKAARLEGVANDDGTLTLWIDTTDGARIGLVGGEGQPLDKVISIRTRR